MRNLKTIINIIIFASLLVSYNAQSATYKIDCPEDFQECNKYIDKKISGKFIQKYPSKDWKIVIPLERFFVLGNGTLKAHFAIAVLPIIDNRTTKSLNSFDFNGTYPRKKYEIDKYWEDIIAIDGGEFSDEKRFNTIPDERVFMAKKVIYIKMVEEATDAMIQDCENSENCILYEQ